MRNVSSASCWPLVRAEPDVFLPVSWVLERSTSPVSWHRRKGQELNPGLKAACKCSGLELSLLRSAKLTLLVLSTFLPILGATAGLLEGPVLTHHFDTLLPEDWILIL